MSKSKVSRTKQSGSTLSFIARMAAGNVDSVLQGQSIIMLDPDQIIIEDQVRKKIDPASIQELANTLESVQQQQPIVVRQAPGQRDTFILEKGQRRVEACRLLGQKVAAVVSGAHFDRKLAHAGQLIENIQREDLNPYEIADALQVFVKEDNMTQRDIADYIGKPQTYVSLHLSLLKSSEALRQLHDDGVVRDADTLRQLRLVIEADPEWEPELMEMLRRDEGITRKQSRQWVAWSKEAQELGVRPSEHIIEQLRVQEEQQEQGPLSEENTNGSLSGTEGEPSGERPGLNVGEGSLLDNHVGPATEEWQGDKTPPVHSKSETVTTTTTTEVHGEGTGDDDQGSPKPQKKNAAQPPEPSARADQLEPGAQPLPGTSAAPEFHPVEQDGYVEYPIGQLELLVEVDGQQGTLMPTRLDDDEDYVWVLFETGAARCKSEEVKIYCMQPVGP